MYALFVGMIMIPLTRHLLHLPSLIADPPATVLPPLSGSFRLSAKQPIVKWDQRYILAGITLRMGQ